MTYCSCSKDMERLPYIPDYDLLRPTILETRTATWLKLLKGFFYFLLIYLLLSLASF